MVGRIPAVMERYTLLPSCPADGDNYLRHLGLVGLWGIHCHPLVSSSVATCMAAEKHRLQRNVLLAAAIWGQTWRGTRVCFRSDNMAVVSVLRSGAAKDSILMHLLRCLHFYVAIWQFSYTAAHIAGSLNTAADALSRNKSSLFHSRSHRRPLHPVAYLVGVLWVL